MSDDLNNLALTGRLTRDAELKYTSGGIPVCKFGLAVNKRRKNGNDWTDYASFFDCILWGPLGESLNRYLVKGKMIALRGELHQNRWEQDGQTRTKVEVMVQDVYLLPGGRREGGGQDREAQGQGYQGYRGPEDVSDDVIF